MKRAVGAALWAFLILWNSDAGALSPREMRVHDVLAECHAAYLRLVDYQGTLRHEVWEEGGGCGGMILASHFVSRPFYTYGGKLVYTQERSCSRAQHGPQGRS